MGNVEKTINVYQHEDIVLGCQRGERRAQFELYRLYARAMFNICLRMTNSVETAEDVLQNSFIDIYSKIHSFRFEATIGAWIKRIVVNNCINQLKKRRLDFTELNDNLYHKPDDSPPSVGGMSSEENEGWDIERVKKAIHHLPDGYRIVFTLYALEGYDHEEIGEVLSISEATSKSQYSRAKAKLREILVSPQHLRLK